jgi:hypothetical protein
LTDAEAATAVTDHSGKAGEGSDFPIAHGGPPVRAAIRLRLLDRHNLAPGRRALLCAAIAWLQLALLSFGQGTAIGALARTGPPTGVGVK